MRNQSILNTVAEKNDILYAPLYRAIAQKIAEQKSVCVAIDGNSAAGKTELAKRIAEKFEGNIFHADDFFLPTALRTPERLAEIGGNFHYERWEKEICLPLLRHQAFSYGIFDCHVMKITRQEKVLPRKLNILEGSYTLHPNLQKYYDIRVFLSTDSAVQHERIRQRNGEQMLCRFVDEWIPKEIKYFEKYRIKESADFLFET